MPLMYHDEDHHKKHKHAHSRSINSNHLDENNQLQPPPKKSSGCCKRVSKFLFSHIGLVAMVIIYSIAGAFLFQLLEQHEEAKECQEGKGQEETNIVNLRSQLLTYIQFNISTNSADTTKDNETTANSNIDQWLQDFRTAVNDNRDSYHYIGQDCSTSKWSFGNALLFAVTVITTIGYGNITPVTWEGQVVCICYATIGIPLFLMCIANISGVLGDMFRFLYSRVCCRLCMKKKKPAQQPNGMAGQAGEFVGDGSGRNDTRSALGIQPVSQWANSKDLDGMNPKAAGYNGAKVVDDNQDFENEIKDEEDDDERVTVPLTITMIIITFYIALGALLFNLFEDWTPVESAYFCYITLATIGFGDFVPGQKTDDPYAGAKLIAGAIYVLFGMAIIAMCFDLMQEEIIAKFTWLGKKLGIVDKDEDDEAEEQAAAEEKKLAEKEKQLKDSDFNKEDMMKKEKPAYVASATPNKDLAPNSFETPTPGYRSNMDDDMGSAKQFRSPYLQNVVQRQQKS